MNFWVDQSSPACVRRVLSGYLAFLLPARLEILQRPLDLLAARALVLVGVPGGGRFRLRHRRAAALGLPLSRQQGIDKYPGNAADRGGGEKGECERLYLHGTLL